MTGFFFLCDHDTERECIDKKLVGTSFSTYNRTWLQKVEPGTVLFLFNYFNQTIWGPMKAVSDVKTWDPSAWKGKFKAQVKVDFGNDLKRIVVKDHKLAIDKIRGIYPKPIIDQYLLKKLFEIFSIPEDGIKVTKAEIFICDDDTAGECFDLGLFGRNNPSTDSIFLGKTLFLYHLGQDVLYGPFAAASRGRDDIDNHAFGGKYPRQVRVSWMGSSSSYLKRQEISGLVEFKDNGLPHRELNLETSKKIVGMLNTKKTSPEAKHGGIRFLEDFRQRFPGKYRTDDGHTVQSRAELVIDNWLYQKKCWHVPEKKLEVPEDCYCDFYLPEHDLYIEYWGLDTPEYNRRRESKESIYKRHSLKLITLSESDLRNLDEVLSHSLLSMSRGS